MKLIIKFFIMAAAIALAGYGIYGAYQQQLLIFIGGRNLEQALLQAQGWNATWLGLALLSLAGSIFCFIGASISRHPVRLERWERCAKIALGLLGACLVAALLQLLLSL